MFWQFETGFISQIDTLLDKENVCLQELMEEENILQECKSQNQKLIQFITRPSVLDEMIDLITNEPPIDLNERIRYKYANIACEIMTSDVNVISDALVMDDSMLTKLYNFIDTDKPLNPLLASFFSKVMGLLFIKKTEVVFEFFKSKDFISLLVNNIETSAIMDLILKLIVSVDNLDLRKTIIKWLFDNDLINKLLNVFKTDCSPQRHINAAQLICDIIKSTREYLSLLQDKEDGDLLLDSLESTEIVSELLDNIFTSRTESSLVSGLSIIQSLLEYKRHSMNINTQNLPLPQTNIQQTTEFEAIPQCYAQQMINKSESNGCEQMTSLDSERLAKGVKQVEAAIGPRLQHFSSLLENPPKREAIKTTVGVIEKPLGATRLEVAHLITALLTTNNIEICDKLAKMNTIPTLIDLFFAYPWNNFLHKHVEQMIACILHNNKSDSNDSPLSSEETMSSSDKCSALVIQLLTQCQLIERISDAFNNKSPLNSEENDVNSKPNYRPKPGYLGHLVIIANMIEDKCNDCLLQQHLTPQTYNNWKAFVERVLTDINKTITTPLVNEMPLSVNMDEESIRQQESVLQQAFIEYQMQQMTRNLCTQIAFSTNDFSEVNESIPNQIDSLSRVNFNFENQLQQKDKSLEFEKICAERAKASLDSNSSDDEDLWEDRDMTFTQSEPKKSVSLISDDSTVFPDNSFDFNSNNPMNRLLTPMDVPMDDQIDPWASEATNSASMAPIPMDTSNPWDNSSANKCENRETITTSSSDTTSIEPDSWADFSSFSTIDFNSSIMTSTSITTSATTSVAPMSSSKPPIASSALPESTTCDEVLAETEEVSTSFDNNYLGMTFPKNVTEDQDNCVTSSTSDAVQNGPNS